LYPDGSVSRTKTKNKVRASPGTSKVGSRYLDKCDGVTNEKWYFHYFILGVV